MADQYATLKTNHGDIVIKLFRDHAPKTVRNFTQLATGTHPEANKQGNFYDGLTFHRVIDGFMIQGGCPLGTGTGDPGYRFDDEIHPELVFDRKYLLAMANAGIQGGRGTNGSQFFITVTEPGWLNRKHTIFGEVEGADSQAVVDAIATVPTGPGDKPLSPVVIESVVIDER